MKTDTEKEELLAVLREAFAYAINKVGMERFKQCTVFGSNLK